MFTLFVVRCLVHCVDNFVLQLVTNIFLSQLKFIKSFIDSNHGIHPGCQSFAFHLLLLLLDGCRYLAGNIMNTWVRDNNTHKNTEFLASYFKNFVCSAPCACIIDNNNNHHNTRLSRNFSQCPLVASAFVKQFKTALQSYS